jgi:hypothetical protein
MITPPKVRELGDYVLLLLFHPTVLYAAAADKFRRKIKTIGTYKDKTHQPSPDFKEPSLLTIYGCILQLL